MRVRWLVATMAMLCLLLVGNTTASSDSTSLAGAPNILGRNSQPASQANSVLDLGTLFGAPFGQSVTFTRSGTNFTAIGDGLLPQSPYLLFLSDLNDPTNVVSSYLVITNVSGKFVLNGTSLGFTVHVGTFRSRTNGGLIVVQAASVP